MRKPPSRIRRMRLLCPLLALMLGAIPTPQSAAVPDIYPGWEQARTDLARALQSAASSNRRVIVDFGGNWCTDCHVLDSYFHEVDNQALLEANYILVHVNVDRMDRNVDLADTYHIPLRKGVPALAVLETNGALLFSQQTGEFEDMRRMQSRAVTEFLRRWKPAARN